MAVDPRIIEAKKMFDTMSDAHDKASKAFKELASKILKEHGRESYETIVSDTICAKSPVGSCCFDVFEDPSQENCLYCNSSKGDE